MSKTSVHVYTPNDRATTQFIGPDAVKLIDDLCTQDIAGLGFNTAAFALFCTNKAQIIVPTLISRIADDKLLAEHRPEHGNPLRAHVKKYKLRANVEINDNLLTPLTIIGEENPHPGAESHWIDTPAYGVPARTEWCLDPNEEPKSGLPNAKCPAASDDQISLLRMHNGTPALEDFHVGMMPAEVGAVEFAVSLTKGCYLGQEPVARLHYRGKANRTLRTVSFSELPPDLVPYRSLAARMNALDVEAGSKPAPEDSVSLMNPDTGKPVGFLTTWTPTGDGSWLARAIIRREIEGGTTLVAGGLVPATVQ